MSAVRPLPRVLVDFGDGQGPHPDPEIPAAVVKHLPYWLRVAELAAAQTPQVARYVISYTRDGWRELTPDDIWILLSDETVMPLPPAPCPVFREMGNRFGLPWRGLRDPALSAAELLLWSRNQLRGVRFVLPRLRRRPAAGWLPLGMPPVLSDDAVIPLEQREFDLAFFGSVSGGRSISPRTIARRHMVKAFERLPADVKWLVDETGGFHESFANTRENYMRLMMRTRFCPAPRGGSLETFRLLEGAHAGCVVISEPLPETWYYPGLPRWELHSWSELPAAVAELRADPARMQAMADGARAWSRDVMSPESIGRYIAGIVNDDPVVAQP